MSLSHVQWLYVLLIPVLPTANSKIYKYQNFTNHEKILTAGYERSVGLKSELSDILLLNFLNFVDEYCLNREHSSEMGLLKC